MGSYYDSHPEDLAGMVAEQIAGRRKARECPIRPAAVDTKVVNVAKRPEREAMVHRGTIAEIVDGILNQADPARRRKL